MGKGDKRRPSQISFEEEQLRWELAFRCVRKPERAEEIKVRLKEIEKEKSDED